MNVTGHDTKLLFCEGGSRSLDYRLLSRLLHGKTPTTVVVPSGGKQGLRSFIRGRLAGYRSPPPYLVFRDRDFDEEPPSEIALIRPRPNRPVFFTYRSAVENYLLDATLIDRYWRRFSQGSPKWAHGNSPGVSVIRSWMDEAARAITSYEATRWALSHLKPGDRWPEVRTTWTEGSGHLPLSLTEDDCLARAKSLVSDYRTATSSVSVDRFVDGYGRFFARFSASEFVAQCEYLVWFHGKDLAKKMQKMRPESISLRHFFSWAVERIDWTRHVDLQQLADMV